MSFECGRLTRPAHFGPLSANYARGRKSFPEETIDFILSHVPAPRPFVLDLGCGTGLATRQLAERGADVIGCDLDVRMIARAAERSSGAIPYVVAEAGAVPLRGGIFDAVTCFSSFHWFEPRSALDEIVRLLRPGGVVAIARKNGSAELRRAFHDLLTQFVDAPIPDSRKGYDPSAILEARLSGRPKTHVVRTVETFPLVEALAFFQSRSGWNLIDERRRGTAEAALNAFCLAHARNGVFTREVAVETFLAIP